MGLTAIIGHGRSPEGQKWGRHIDRRCDTVVRMWDWAWQNEVDYGTKYDYGLFELYPFTYASMKKHNVKTPERGWIGSLLRMGETLVPPPKTEIVDQKRWTRIGRNMGGIGETGRLELTRGTIAALWAIEQSERGDQIVLVGFDNVKEGKAKALDEAFSPEYQKNVGTYPFDKYVGGVSKYGNHDYFIEYPLMKALAELHGSMVSFADDIWGQGLIKGAVGR